MKRLNLLRHAKSSWDDPVERDFDRPLNARGRKAARTVGRELRAIGLAFDRTVASPAARVTQTLQDLEEGYGGSLQPEFDRRIYLASAAQLLEIVQETDAAINHLLLVGHNPGLEMLALLLSASDPLRFQLEEKYPTATIAQIVLPVERWSDVAEGIGQLTHFIRPRDLDPELGPDESA